MKFFKYLIQVHMQIELQTTVKFKQTKPEYIWKEQLRIITLTWQGLIGLFLRRISPLSLFFLSHNKIPNDRVLYEGSFEESFLEHEPLSRGYGNSDSVECGSRLPPVLDICIIMR